MNNEQHIHSEENANKKEIVWTCIPISKKRLIWGSFAIPILFVVLFYLYYQCLPYIFSNKHDESFGDVGCSYGTLAALFTGLAFAGLIVTIMLQQTACRQLDKQQRMVASQMFEASFYNQLHHVYALIKDTQITFYPDDTLNRKEMETGHQAMNRLFDIIEEVGKKLQEGQQLSKHEEETIRQADTSISSFLRTFFSSVSMLIDNTDITDERRKLYIELFSDSLTFTEAYLLGIYGRTYQYNCNEQRTEKVLAYMTKHHFWQRPVITDVFGSYGIFSSFIAVVNKNNKDQPYER